MKPLTEKYRPRTLDQIRGNDRVVNCLKSFAKNPVSKAFLLSGPAGTGKTSAAYALAGALGVDVEKKEWGGLHEIASGEMTAETVREMFKTTMNYSTWHGSGWKVVIANEADNMSEKAAFIWLDVLEHLPAKCVVVFTTNDPEKLPARFRQRCESHVFKTPARGFDQPATPAEIAAQALIDDVWRAELGHNHSPSLSELDGWREGGNVSFRAVLSALDPLIRCQREIDLEQAAKVKAELPATIAAQTPSARPSAGALIRQIQAALAVGDFETAKRLEAMAG